MKDRNELLRIAAGEEGAIGYLLAWLMGVPAVVLLIVYMVAN